MRSAAIAALVGLVVVAGTGMAGAQEASPSSAMTVRLLVINRANVQPDVLKAAEDDAATIYRAAGVQTTWVNEGAGGLYQADFTVILVSGRQNPYMAAHVAGAAMGFTLASSTDAADRGQTAYALYDRVEENAGTHHASVSRVLGEVIAHEVGHLLLSFGSHSDRGIMQAK